MTEEIIALDLETTGLNPRTDQILELGAARIRNGRVEDTYAAFINIGKKIPEFIVGLTGITDEMAEGGLPLGEALDGFLDFCGEAPILGHNILFDYSFLKQKLANAGRNFDREGIDTLALAKKFLPELPSRTLEALCLHYGISQEKKHRAYEDALSAYHLYECLSREFFSVSPVAFEPKQLVYHVKKESPVTISQKRYLNDLIKYHRIETDAVLEKLTKSEASRMIDNIISQYGKIKR